jgi:hypothetical protein
VKGYIYVITDGEFCKIGKTWNVGMRLADLQTASPRKLRIVHEIETEFCDYLEADLHLHFARKHVLGEWYQLDQGDIDWIKAEAWIAVKMPTSLSNILRQLRRIGVQVNVENSGGVLTIQVYGVAEARDDEGVYFVPAAAPVLVAEEVTIVR